MRIIYAIPGLGTTKELFRNISIPNYELRVLEWPLPEKNITLKDYADKFANQIDQNKPVHLLGVSFGGMLCAQLAENIQTNKVFLISSCGNRNQFPRALKLMRLFPAYKLVSEKMIRSIAKTKRALIGFEKSFEPVFRDMINKMPNSYFSYCIDYLINWNLKTNRSSIVRIHGTADKLLPAGKTNTSYLIREGSHAMVLTRADEINQILNKELNGL